MITLMLLSVIRGLLQRLTLAARRQPSGSPQKKTGIEGMASVIPARPAADRRDASSPKNGPFGWVVWGLGRPYGASELRSRARLRLLAPADQPLAEASTGKPEKGAPWTAGTS